MAEIEEKWRLIGKNEPLSPGDRIRIYYTVIGPTYLAAFQIAAIEDKIEDNPDLNLLATSLPEGGGWVKDMWFGVEILKPKVGEKLIKYTPDSLNMMIQNAARPLGLGWFVLNEFRKEVVEPVIETIKKTGWTTAKIAAAAVIGYIALNWWKK